MSLPILNAPQYTLTVPSTKKKIKFRPFLVKEEKILLMAKESNNLNDIVSAIKTIITNCTYGKIDVNELATFDIEYIFLQIRGESVGKTIELSFVCNNKKGKKVCGESVPFMVDLKNLKVKFPKGHDKKIKITETIGCVMRYPEMDTILELGEIEKTKDFNIISLICESIEMIWDKDEIHYTKDLPKQDIIDFLDSMTTEQFKGFKQFFETMPSISYDIKTKCPKCESSINYTLRGIQDFFG